ncbi:MAG: GNAT family N-acetyltransferase [Patescibacteria group bacterium]|nr:GNAT family N-acetyltransferase [Patescibacteria group bacterium]
MKIVFQGKTKKDVEIVIRYPQVGDEHKMWRYINELSKEKTFIRFQGEEVSFEEEEEYVKSQLQKINEKKAITLLGFNKNKLIAISDINMRDKTEKHIGVFGISVAKDFRNEGIGRLLMEKVFEEAVRETPTLKIVTLEVYSKNSIAKRIYEGFGFKEYGLLPNGISRDNAFEDAILMYKNIK